MPKLSIIVPIYNTEKYLHRCIDSILSQSFTDFELLLIDDGSKDESGTVCDKYSAKDARIKVFHKENGGVSSARNLGLDKAQGEWITFIDADDYIEPNFFPTIFDDEIDMYVQNWKYDELGSTGYEEWLPAQRITNVEDYISFLYQYAHWDLFRTPWAKFFKMEIINRFLIRFDSRFRYGEDTLFMFEYETKIKAIYVLASSYYCYLKSIEHRYCLHSDEAIEYFDAFIKIYEKQSIKLPNLVDKLWGIFYNHTITENTIWLLNSKVLAMQAARIPFKSWKKIVNFYIKSLILKREK